MNRFLFLIALSLTGLLFCSCVPSVKSQRSRTSKPFTTLVTHPLNHVPLNNKGCLDAITTHPMLGYRPTTPALVKERSHLLARLSYICQGVMSTSDVVDCKPLRMRPNIAQLREVSLGLAIGTLALHNAKLKGHLQTLRMPKGTKRFMAVSSTGRYITSKYYGASVRYVVGKHTACFHWKIRLSR